MNPTDYVNAAIRTAPNSGQQTAVIGYRIDCNEGINLLHASMGMVTESAEFQDMLKKHFIYGKPFDKVNAIEEIGDILWYIALAAKQMDVSIEHIMDVNIAKLRKRFPERFVETQAINRDTVAERTVLEDGARA